MASNAMSQPGTTPLRPSARAEAGLSIVVPVFNEAAGLPALHERIVEVARRLRADARPRDRSRSMSTTAAATPRSRSRRAAGRCARRPGGLALAQFRQGGGAARRPRSCPPRRRPVHGRRRPASAHAGRDAWSGTGSMTATTWSTPPRPTARASRGCAGSAVKAFYALINWGARQKIPRGRRRFPPAVAARRRRAASSCPSATASSKGSRAGSAFARSASTTSRPSARTAARTWNVYPLIGLSIEGLTSFSVAPLRLASLLGLLLAAARAHLRRADPDRDVRLRPIGAGLSVGGRRPDGARRRAADHDRHHGRVHRQDPVRAQGAAGLFRGRAQREDRRRTPTVPSDPPARSAAE